MTLYKKYTAMLASKRNMSLNRQWLTPDPAHTVPLQFYPLLSTPCSNEGTIQRPTDREQMTII